MFCSVNVLHEDYKNRLVVTNKVGIVALTIGIEPVLYEHKAFMYYCTTSTTSGDRLTHFAPHPTIPK